MGQTISSTSIVTGAQRVVVEGSATTSLRIVCTFYFLPYRVGKTQVQKDTQSFPHIAKFTYTFTNIGGNHLPVGATVKRCEFLIPYSKIP